MAISTANSHTKKRKRLSRQMVVAATRTYSQARSRSNRITHNSPFSKKSAGDPGLLR